MSVSPPAYEESTGVNASSSGASPNVVTNKDVERNAPPPSYDSLFGKLKAANEESENKFDCLKTSMGIVCGSVIFIICVGLLLAIPITEIAIGASYLYDCPAQRLIPIYLVVAGVFGTIKGIATMGQSIKTKKDQDNGNNADEFGKPNATNPFDSLLNMFLFAWFICGNVWVYGLKDEWVSSPVTAGNYCHPTLYYFSFWIITSAYIMMGVVCLFGCIMLGIICCCVAKSDD